MDNRQIIIPAHGIRDMRRRRREEQLEAVVQELSRQRAVRRERFEFR